MTKIKICGLSGVDDALVAAKAGADFLGMVFAPSRRQVNLESALKLVEAVRTSGYQSSLTGVFVNEDPEQLNQIASTLQLDWIQLSGDENWEYCRNIERPIIKVIHVLPGTKSSEISGKIEAGLKILDSKACLLLLDTGHPDAYGGTGQPFNWQIAKDICESVPVIIAGGIDINNIGSLIGELHPWGIDVSSGIETGGVKDASKITAFITEVRTLDSESNTAGQDSSRRRR